jgi:energy-coupling factor transporter ATP-binding protein EcfA2
MDIINFPAVTKRYNSWSRPRGNKVLALDDFSLQIEPGEVFGFLGPNVTGKSTALNILLNFVYPVQVLFHLWAGVFRTATCGWRRSLRQRALSRPRLLAFRRTLHSAENTRGAYFGRSLNKTHCQNWGMF